MNWSNAIDYLDLDNHGFFDNKDFDAAFGGDEIVDALISVADDMLLSNDLVAAPHEEGGLSLIDSNGAIDDHPQAVTRIPV